MKVITFSTRFPKGHPSAGAFTFFPELIWAGLPIDDGQLEAAIKPYKDVVCLQIVQQMRQNGKRAKLHTIRAGDRWKVGETFQPRVWQFEPYRSKQLDFCPPLTLTHVQGFVFDGLQYHTAKPINDTALRRLAANDGLTVDEFKAWFTEPFAGQILSWHELSDNPYRTPVEVVENYDYQPGDIVYYVPPHLDDEQKNRQYGEVSTVQGTGYSQKVWVVFNGVTGQLTPKASLTLVS